MQSKHHLVIKNIDIFMAKYKYIKKDREYSVLAAEMNADCE
jgi:hypothetical protein